MRIGGSCACLRIASNSRRTLRSSKAVPILLVNTRPDSTHLVPAANFNFLCAAFRGVSDVTANCGSDTSEADVIGGAGDSVALWWGGLTRLWPCPPDAGLVRCIGLLKSLPEPYGRMSARMCGPLLSR